MKKIIYTIAVFVYCISIKAEENVGHVIVAFDRATPNYQFQYSDVNTLHSIDNFIKQELRFDKLYLSVVGYVLNGKSPDIDRFVMPYTDSVGKPILWYKYESLIKQFPKWPNGQPSGTSNYVKPASMQSLAKPYCVMETAVWEKSQQAEFTYVLFVTDEKIQGIDDDYAAEWKKMISYNETAYKRIEHQVFQRLQHFNEKYRFELHKRKALYNQYAMVMYKLLPTSNPSIFSVSDMPSQLPIKRVRGGYIIDCRVKSNDLNYKVCDWTVISAKGNAFEHNSEGKLFVRSNMLYDGDSIEIRMVLQQTDSLYGGILLNKGNCRGMALRQEVKINDDNKIWGVMPLSDTFWWWMPDDVMAAVKIWEYIIFILFISCLAYIYRTLSKYLGLYRPSNKRISMTVKTSK